MQTREGYPRVRLTVERNKKPFLIMPVMKNETPIQDGENGREYIIHYY